MSKKQKGAGFLERAVANLNLRAASPLLRSAAPYLMHVLENDATMFVTGPMTRKQARSACLLFQRGRLAWMSMTLSVSAGEKGPSAVLTNEEVLCVLDESKDAGALTFALDSERWLLDEAPAQ